MIGDNLKFLRIKYKYTMEVLAEKIGVSRQSVAKWENNETLPDLLKCNELAKIYDISIDALVNGRIEELLSKEDEKNKVIVGLTTVDNNGCIKLPEKAFSIFGINIGDSLILLGHKSKGGIAMVKVDNNNWILKE